MYLLCKRSKCKRIVETSGAGVPFTLAALLHDASECYMSDVPRPLKQEMSAYRKIEDDLLKVIYGKFLGTPLTPEEETQIKIIDDDLLWYDLETLLDEKQETEKPKLHIDLDYTVRPFKVVEKEYLEIFKMFHVKH